MNLYVYGQKAVKSKNLQIGPFEACRRLVPYTVKAARQIDEYIIECDFDHYYTCPRNYLQLYDKCYLMPENATNYYGINKTCGENFELAKLDRIDLIGIVEREFRPSTSVWMDFLTNYEGVYSENIHKSDDLRDDDDYFDWREQFNGKYGYIKPLDIKDDNILFICEKPYKDSYSAVNGDVGRYSEIFFNEYALPNNEVYPTFGKYGFELSEWNNSGRGQSVQRYYNFDENGYCRSDFTPFIKGNYMKCHKAYEAFYPYSASIGACKRRIGKSICKHCSDLSGMLSEPESVEEVELLGSIAKDGWNYYLAVIMMSDNLFYYNSWKINDPTYDFYWSLWDHHYSPGPPGQPIVLTKNKRTGLSCKNAKVQFAVNEFIGPFEACRRVVPYTVKAARQIDEYIIECDFDHYYTCPRNYLQFYDKCYLMPENATNYYGINKTCGENFELAKLDRIDLIGIVEREFRPSTSVWMDFLTNYEGVYSENIHKSDDLRDDDEYFDWKEQFNGKYGYIKPLDIKDDNILFICEKPYKNSYSG
ncbi:unnamed protein product [Caenorhabditis bovis]|uniref:C-type lectin domain-containing protein n=1 Tax=Caenorhabditis bovis TaxID=2654633 RepID=A0A8S1FAS1_9PELO|nr:unnamed protein product [Caenorhabditis bovis]